MTCCDTSLRIAQGTTFTRPYRWGQEPLVYKDISAQVAATPLTITVANHGVVDGWPVAFTDLLPGLDALNAVAWPPVKDTDFYIANVLDANTLLFNELDASRVGIYNTSAPNGKVGYFTPVSLAGASASFAIYPSGSSTAALTVTPTLDDTAKTITVALSAAQTTALPVGDYVYVLLVTQVSGSVTLLAKGELHICAVSADVG